MKIFIECPNCKHGQAVDPADEVWTCTDCAEDMPQELREVVLHNWKVGDEHEAPSAD